MPNDLPARPSHLPPRWILLAMVPAVMWISGMVSNAHPGNPDDLPGRDAPSSLVLAPAEEPGSPLLVRGRIYAPDGQTPVEGVVLYVYQTGADGRYAPPGERTPRLRGWVRTDEEGRYAYRTVRPGPYPGRSIPAHIHAVLWGGGYPPQWGGDILFEDDPLVDSGERRASREAERFAHVCSPLATEEGELSCTRNYRLKPGADPVSDEIAHAFQGPVED